MRPFQIGVFLVLLLPWTTAPSNPNVQLTLSKPEEFQEAFAKVPCRSKDRLPAVKALFLQMGASEADITVEKRNGAENIIVRKQGDSDEKIILGAHYDFIGNGSCGAIDNWTGIVTLAHLYKTLKTVRLKKTLLFVGFDREETGMVGSKAMVNEINKAELPSYCAMVNIDSLGLNSPQVLKHISSPKLVALAEEMAQKMKMQYQAVESVPGASDSVAFRARDIPALTISAISNDWPNILHHSADQAKRIDPVSVYLGYRWALILAVSLDGSECGAYRSEKSQ